MTRKLALLILLLPSLACSLLTRASMGGHEQFIQGAWMYSEDQGDGHSSYLKWTFNAGYFEVEGYPPLVQAGQYQVVKSEGQVLVVRLTHQAGDWPSDDREMELMLDRAADTLMIEGQGPFTRSQ